MTGHGSSGCRTVDIPGQVDGVGPARYLADDAAELRSKLAAALDDRAVVRLGDARRSGTC